MSQTDGEPLPEFSNVKGIRKTIPNALKRFIAARAIELAYDPGIAPARGMSSGGRITLMPDLAPAGHFAVRAHEILHAAPAPR